MKYISFAIGALLYLGSMSFLNNAYAHNYSDRSGIRILFQDMDLTDEQRKEVRSIMSSSIKEGRGLRAEMREQSMDAMDDLKKGTKKKLSEVLSEKQMAQFDKNSKRMEKRKEKMRDKKMRGHGKGKKKRNKKRHMRN
jgi:hypothetical protein